MSEMAEDHDEYAGGSEAEQERMVGDSVQDTQRSYGVGNGGSSSRREPLRRRNSEQAIFFNCLLIHYSFPIT
jgi:hypothetical protein